MSGHGDGPCKECGGPNTAVWFTDNSLWNDVLEPGSTEDPGGFMCIPCFIALAETRLDPVCWRLTPEFPRREQTPIWFRNPPTS